jgi:hypothetical protein
VADDFAELGGDIGIQRVGNVNVVSTDGELHIHSPFG